MMTKIATCLLACALLAACETTTKTTTTTTTAAHHQKLADRMLAENQPYQSTVGQPPPPAEGPEDTRTVDPVRNPALLPSPLLRQSAAGGL